jgi:hypothetical protein
MLTKFPVEKAFLIRNCSVISPRQARMKTIPLGFRVLRNVPVLTGLKSLRTSPVLKVFKNVPVFVAFKETVERSGLTDVS